VIFSHGFSDSHVIRNPDDKLTASLGARWIAADQPGVGGSSPKKGRKMVDWGADIEELADRSGLHAFNVAGHSGVGPQALAIAFHMSDRVAKVTLASPVAPFDEPGATKEGVHEMTMALWDWGFSPGAIATPAELIYGTDDDIISPAMPLHLCKELPNGTSHQWAGAGHYGFVDRENWIQFVTAAVHCPRRSVANRQSNF